MVGENGLAADLGDVSQMTTAQMMRQYKRKLATIGGDDGDGPATPVRRTRAVARPAAAFDAVWPNQLMPAVLHSPMDTWRGT